MGKLRCTLMISLFLGSFFDIAPQLDHVSLVDSKEAFTTFATACAQAFTSTIDVSLAIPAYISCEEAELCPKSSH